MDNARSSSLAFNSGQVKYVVQSDDNEPQEKNSKVSARWSLIFSTAVLVGIGLGGYYLFDKYLGEGEDIEEEVIEEGLPFIEEDVVATPSECSTLECEFGESAISEMAGAKGWTLIERAGSSDRLKFTVALKPSNVDELKDLLLHTSTPGDDLYGLHLSVNKVNDIARPSEESISTVMEWLDADMSHYHEAGFIIKSMTVQEVESLLNVEYWIFTDANGRKITRLSTGYTIPQNLQDHISFLSPTIRFPSISSFQNMAACGGTVPEYLRDLYSIGEEGESESNKQAVTAFLGEYFHQVDQDLFYKHMYPLGAGTTIEVKGTAVQQPPGGMEAMLDTQYVTVTGTNITTEFWSYDGRAPDNDENEPFLDWVLDVGITADSVVPKLFSTSYGEDEDTVSWQYASRIDVEFIKCGLRGISLLFASGDSGATSDFGGCPGGKFTPMYPACSPWVTAVGGTTQGATNKDEVTAWSFSSGGFSNRYNRPAWQQEWVQTYLEDPVLLSLKDFYNNQGRGFPDVASMATAFPIIVDKEAVCVSGTSCSSPTFGGIIGLLNDQRLQRGESTLGFLNPWLYLNASAGFTDVTVGKNIGCDAGDSELGDVGFPALVGWDAVTGLGWPIYEKLKNLL